MEQMQQEQFLRLSQVIELTGLSKSTIWKWIHTKEFPKQLKLSPRKSVWKKTEILAWMEEQYV